MKILTFNWRDIRNPEAGGAEIYTHQILKRFARSGYDVTLFTSRFKGCNKKETIDGVNIVREGNRYSVYRKAKRFYKKSNFDLVIDEINTVPFFTPKFVNGPVVALIHQLCREFWFYEVPLPFSIVGYCLENRWLRNYTSFQTVTVSESTRSDLLGLGFKRVSIVPNGLNVNPLARVPEKSEKPSILFLGRMKRAKKPQDVLKCFAKVRDEISDAELWMVGDGYLRKKLEKKKVKDVRFFGYVNEETKWNLIKRAWLLIVPGVREGWGQVVTDANALGTPAVGYDVPGLRDSILHEKTGLLAEYGDVDKLANCITELLTNKKLRKKMSMNAILFAKKFSWDKSAERFEKIIGDALEP